LGEEKKYRLVKISIKCITVVMLQLETNFLATKT